MVAVHPIRQTRTVAWASSPHSQGWAVRGDLQLLSSLPSSLYVGIDVSKAHLDVAFGLTEEPQRFTNDEKGIGQLEKLLTEVKATLVVMEATGGLEIPVAAALTRLAIPMAVVNPRQVRDFARAIGVLAKTDAIDARILARFGEAVKPQPRRAKEQQSQALQDFVSRRRQLVEMIAAEKVRRTMSRPSIVEDIDAHIAFLQKRLKRAAIFEYIEVWYNRKRRHSTLGYVSPEQYESQLPNAA